MKLLLATLISLFSLVSTTKASGNDPRISAAVLSSFNSAFKNAAEALTYVDQTRPKTSSEIIPWLKGGKYSYSIITGKNLEVLKNSKDLDKYKQFLDKNVPGKF